MTCFTTQGRSRLARSFGSLSEVGPPTVIFLGMTDNVNLGRLQGILNASQHPRGLLDYTTRAEGRGRGETILTLDRIRMVESEPERLARGYSREIAPRLLAGALTADEALARYPRERRGRGGEGRGMV